MSPWVAVARALPLTFVVYVSTTLLGTLQAIPSVLELQRITTLPLGRPSTTIASIEHLLALVPAGRALGLTLLISLLAWGLVTPWLHMAWLSALSEPRSPASALGHGGRLLWRALLTSLWVGLFSLVLLAPFPLLAWLVRSWLDARVNVRVQDLATLLFLAPTLASLCVVLAWHDLARARCLSCGAFKAARLSLRDAVRSRYLGSYMGFAVLSWSLFFIAQWILLRSHTHSTTTTLVSIAFVQGVALLRCVVRSRWLTQALMAADDLPSHNSKDGR